jgi:Tyrosine-protein kinase ephrin type A/B receptor-like/Regulator of chromosome condensation (RCC1) repeat
MSATTCTRCQAGTYSSKLEGSVTCTSCPMGTYSAEMRATNISTCTSCPAGTWSATMSATDIGACTDCQAGTYSSKLEGSVTCTKCPKDTWSATVRAAHSANCTNCMAGTYSAVVGATNNNTCTTTPCHLSVHGELVDCVGGPEFSQKVRPETGFFQKLATTGLQHACAIRHRTGRVACWSTVARVCEEINVPDFVIGATSLSLGMHHSCAIWGPKETLTCWGSDTMITSVSPVNVSQGVRMLAVGHPASRHTCFLRQSTNDVSCFGSNEFGQIGLGAAGADIGSVTAQKVRPD